jgi:hypothetical protein
LVLFNYPFCDGFATFIFFILPFYLAIAKMVKKFIQRRYVCKLPRSSLARPSRPAVTAAPSSGGSSPSSSSLLASLPFGVCGALLVEKAPPTETSVSVPSLWKEEDPAAAPAANLVSVPPIDAASVEVDLIVLSSDSEDEVDWEALIAGDEVARKLLPLKMSTTSSLWVAGPHRGSNGGLDMLLLALALMLA